MNDLWWLPERHLIQLRWPSGTCPWRDWRGGIHPALRAPIANDNGQAWWQS